MADIGARKGDGCVTGKAVCSFEGTTISWQDDIISSITRIKVV